MLTEALLKQTFRHYACTSLTEQIVSEWRSRGALNLLFAGSLVQLAYNILEMSASSAIESFSLNTDQRSNGKGKDTETKMPVRPSIALAAKVYDNSLHPFVDKLIDKPGYME